MRIRSNTSAMGVRRELGKTSRAMAKNLEKLSSGYRINRAADDASGLGVSERMRANIAELDRCHNNAAEGLNLAKTADGALAEINDMLCRARELCVQAANGTYSELELASISDEMNELFSEIDRITEGSTFNEIRLFRGKVEQDIHYEYDETFAPVGAGTEVWGEMDFVKTEDFDEPPVATAATATFQLDEDIDFNDVSTLNGRSIKIGTYTYYFSDGTVNVPNNGYYVQIFLKGKTTEEALKDFINNVSTSSSSTYYPASIELDRDARTVTITASLQTLDAGTFEADGMTLPNQAPKGNGAWANGQVIASTPAGSTSLNQVDGEGIKNNPVTYSTTATASISLSQIGSTLNGAVNDLKENKLTIAGVTIKLADLTLTSSMTKEDFGKALAAKIQANVGSCTATYDSANGRINVTLSNLPSSKMDSHSVSSSVNTTTVDAKTKDMFTSTSLGLSGHVETPASGERPEVYKVTVSGSPTAPFSCTINGRQYLFYDSSKQSLLESGYDHTRYYVGSSSCYPTVVNIAGRDPISTISGCFQKSGVGSIQVNGNTITITASGLNSSMGLSAGAGNPIRVESYKYPTSTANGKKLFFDSDFYQTATVPFSLGTEADIGKLAGSGFSIGGSRFEFTDGTGLHGDYRDIDISGCTTFDQLKAKVQAVMGSTYTVDIDKTDPANAKLIYKASVTNSISVTDGATGISGLISGGGTVSYADGSDIGYSQKAIDFSSINSENLNDLLGKGFRINCATCKGEYINVFFCWENNGRAPESFEIDYNGEKRTIHNVAVELSKVTSGDQIVQSIVDQVRPTLTHFTDVEVGTPPTVLIAKDKRIGGAHVGNQLQLGEVQTGLDTNFTYSVNIREVRDFPEDGSVSMKNANVDIYVGSEPNPQIIPIHLPYLDLPTLRLSPPELVDLNHDDQNPSDWLDRVDQASLAISEARGVIGADHNRLEHAVQSLSSAHENLVDAESRIRDADMAELFMEHVKNQILTQSQQTMLSQAASQPQQVLQLLS